MSNQIVENNASCCPWPCKILSNFFCSLDYKDNSSELVSAVPEAQCAVSFLAFVTTFFSFEFPTSCIHRFQLSYFSFW